MNPDSRLVSPLKFFTLTFILSWLVWIPLDLSHFGIGPLQISEMTSSMVRLLGVLMPAMAALILTGLNGGRQALHDLFTRLTIWRVGIEWWVVAIFVQPVLLFFAGLIYNLFSPNSPITIPATMTAAEFIVNVIMLLIATLGEEIGWRGVALPSLQQKNNPAKSSLILGFLWAVWHLPFWLLLDTYSQFGVAYLAMNFLFVIPITFNITWFFNHSRSSLLLPVGFHLAFNIVNTILFPVTASTGAFAIFVALDWALTLYIFPRLARNPQIESSIHYHLTRRTPDSNQLHR